MNRASSKRVTASQEDYLEAIWMLTWTEGVARVRDIADRLSVSMPSVTGALKALAKRKLVEYSPYKYVTLSERGMELAERVSARHGIVRKFLTDVLNVKADLADTNACRIEHAVDEVVSRQLSCFVEFVSQNAEASQLAERFKDFCQQRKTNNGDGDLGASGAGLMTLANIKPGQKAKVVRMAGSAAANRKLAEAGIARESVVSVVRVALLGDPIEIEVRGRNLAIRRNEAMDIEVEKQE